MNSPCGSCRIGVFYDGNFLLHASNYYNYIHPVKRRLSLGGLHNFIRHRVAEEEGIEPSKCQIAQAHYFRGRLNAAEAAQRGNQLYNDRVFDDILMSEGIQPHYLPLRNLQGKKEERGIDVWLSLEAYELAMTGRIDTVVLIVSDTDYTPLMRKLTGLGLRIMLFSWEFEYVNDDGVKMVTKTSHELLSLATYPVAMHDVINYGVQQNNPLISEMFVAPDPSRQAREQTFETSEILSLKNGFGFIKYPNNNLFFHYQDVVGEFADLNVGDPVEFTIEQNQQKQDVAKNVRKLLPSEIKKIAKKGAGL
ncbi:NYN domain-containing protein [uncultured Alistipes sp.]|uniref:NYN domain-containing protein n=1 Tax=uncultured Alistipes sp. TaxID=538949 RepID=UPI00259AE647|nr:NYN domain-containing protein [uncultured Alistipes sp.]